MSKIAHATDAMIRRYEEELRERHTACQVMIANAQDGNRDLNTTERETISSNRSRIAEIQGQMESLEAVSKLSAEETSRRQVFERAMVDTRRPDSDLEYRSAGAWALDTYQASIGDRSAAERLETFHRVAAHQKTADNLGIIPDPIVGSVINFIDASRPLVSFVGTSPLTSATWHRPKVTQQPQVGVQGSAGAASDEKAELVSRKMLITRLTGYAVTYGGYVNVSRQNIDFSSPQGLDFVINGLAGQYAIETEAALAAEFAATGASPIGYGATPTAATIHAAIWAAVAQVYAAVKGQGRLFITIAPDRLALFGPLFAPINVLAAAIAGQGGQASGFNAMNFGQGLMGSISGIPVVMSAGLGAGEAFVSSTAAVEAFEQRIGTLQVTEPSVLGLQVAYAGYFTPLTIEDDGIVPLTATDES